MSQPQDTRARGGRELSRAEAYSCSVCKRGVAVLDGKIIRACPCVGPVHANMAATTSLAAAMALAPAPRERR